MAKVEDLCRPLGHLSQLKKTDWLRTISGSAHPKRVKKSEFFPPFPARCSGHILHSVAPFQHRFLSTCHTQDLVTALPAYGKFMSNNSHLSHTISGNGTHQFPINFQLSLYQEWLHAVPVAGIARNSTLAIVRTDLQSSQKAAHTWHQSQDDTK